MVLLLSFWTKDKGSPITKVGMIPVQSEVNTGFTRTVMEIDNQLLDNPKDWAQFIEATERRISKVTNSEIAICTGISVLPEASRASVSLVLSSEEDRDLLREEIAKVVTQVVTALKEN